MAMNEKGLSQAVQLVDRTLNVLRYFGQEEDSAFTGESIEASIVVLPGLLLDIRVNDLLKKGEQKRVCSIGGKAARTARMLWGLVSPYDESITPYLITKTSPFGSLMLRNELAESDARTLYDSKYIDYIHIDPSISEPRCAARLKQDEIKRESCKISIQLADEREQYVVVPRAYNVKSELNTCDLEDNLNAIPIIRKARTIFMASMTTPHYEALYKTIISHIPKNSYKLVLDLTRHVAEDQVSRQIKKIRRNKSKIGGLFVPVQSVPVNRIRETVDSYWKDSRVSIIAFGDDQFFYVDKDTGEITKYSIEKEIKFSKENVSEAFKAGVLVAWSAYSALSEISDKECHRGLKKHLFGRWSKPWDISISFGIALARSVERQRISPTMQTLARSHSSGEETLYDSEQSVPAKIVTNNGAKALSFSQSNLSSLISLLKSRQNKSLQERTLSLCREVKCSEGCLGYSQTCERKRAAVLIDLDGTLIDSEVQRRRMVSKAIATLIVSLKDSHSNIMFEPLNETVEKFELYVYGLWPIFKSYGIGNFRQQWNHVGWYASLIVLFNTQNKVYQQIAEWYGDNKVATKTIAALEKMDVAKIKWLGAYKEQYDFVLLEFNNEIQHARHVFNSTKIYPFNGVRDFLESLKMTESFELYVVTEGEADTQWMKILNSGLHKYFDRSHVLTTSDAGEPTSEIIKLRWERAALKSEVEDAEKSIGKLESSLLDLDRLGNDILELSVNDDERETELVNIIRPHKNKLLKLRKLKREQRERYLQIENVGEFAQYVIRRLAKKDGKAFYSAVIRAILRDPVDALEELKSFDNLMKDIPDKNRMKFVMIGDRQDNDVEWPKALLGKSLLSIRLMSSKYANETKQSESATINVKEELRPNYIVHTISQAKLLLLNKNIWDAMTCIRTTPVFDWRIDHKNRNLKANISEKNPAIGLEYILLGLELHIPKYDLIHKICSGVFCDFIEGISKDEAGRVLKKVFESGDSCAGRKASVIDVYVSGLIASGYDQINTNIVTWLETTVDEICKINNTPDDPLYHDKKDLAYHMQQCHDAIQVIRAVNTIEDSCKRQLNALMTKVHAVVSNDDRLSGNVKLAK